MHASSWSLRVAIISVPSECAAEAEALVESGKVARWFSINYEGTRYADLITGVPVGLYYPFKNDLMWGPDRGRRGTIRVDMRPPRVQEAERQAILATGKPLRARVAKAFVDFQFHDAGERFGEARPKIHARLLSNPSCVFLPRRVRPAELLREDVKHAFVVSPHGNALDGTRPWEALLSGCIPILKRSCIDHLYAGLPVAFVDDWDEISPDNLERWVEEHADFDRARVEAALSTEHWLTEIEGAQDRARGRAGPGQSPNTSSASPFITRSQLRALIAPK